MMIMMMIIMVTMVMMVMMLITTRDVREEDFGNYTCHATNPLGQARFINTNVAVATASLLWSPKALITLIVMNLTILIRQEIVVSGKPLPPVFLSGEPGDKTEYTLRCNIIIIMSIIPCC